MFPPHDLMALQKDLIFIDINRLYCSKFTVQKLKTNNNNNNLFNLYFCVYLMVAILDQNM